MNIGKTIFAQVMEFVPWTSFERIVNHYSGNAGVRRMNCAEQFRVMAFAQLTWRESLRDIEVTLAANRNKLYAIGLRHDIDRSILADANESRDWHIWLRSMRRNSPRASRSLDNLRRLPFNNVTHHDTRVASTSPIGRRPP